MSAKKPIRIEHGFIPQPGPQVAYLKCPCDIVVYGGARGGGKTFARWASSGSTPKTSARTPAG